MKQTSAGIHISVASVSFWLTPATVRPEPSWTVLLGRTRHQHNIKVYADLWNVLKDAKPSGSLMGIDHDSIVTTDPVGPGERHGRGQAWRTACSRE